MKKQLLFFVLGATVLAFGCKKKSDPGQDDPFKLEYSNNTVEQNKAELETSGTEFVKEFSTLPDEPFIDVLDVFSTLNFEAIDVDAIGVNSINNIKVAAVRKNIKMFVSPAQGASTDVAKLSGVYGIYVWNATDEEFVKQTATDKVEFRFPSTEGGTSNDATLTFTYEVGLTATIDDEKVELPKKSTTTLKVGSQTLLSVNTSHEYKSDGTPTKSNVVAVMGAFEMSNEVVNDGNNASVSFAIKKGTKALMSISASGDGKGTVSAIEEDEDDLINNGNFTLEVMNFKFTGKADIKSIIEENDAISDTNNESRINKEAAIFNKYAQLVVVNTTDNTIIAKLEMKGEVGEEDCYSYTYWDGTRDVTVINCETSTELIPMLIFKDGTKQSFEDYGENGFQAVIDEFEKLTDKF
ncbi:MAG TPA: hypothetical protein VFM79_01600 [Pelobium sp.]|nr:hypothetical protein [Pelobium sp.]